MKKLFHLLDGINHTLYFKIQSGETAQETLKAVGSVVGVDPEKH